MTPMIDFHRRRRTTISRWLFLPLRVPVWASWQWVFKARIRSNFTAIVLGVRNRGLHSSPAAQVPIGALAPVWKRRLRPFDQSSLCTGCPLFRHGGSARHACWCASPVLLVPGIAGSILNAVNDKTGKKERVWVQILRADLEFQDKLWSHFDPQTG